MGSHVAILNVTQDHTDTKIIYARIVKIIKKQLQMVTPASNPNVSQGKN